MSIHHFEMSGYILRILGYEVQVNDINDNYIEVIAEDGYIPSAAVDLIKTKAKGYGFRTRKIKKGLKIYT